MKIRDLDYSNNPVNADHRALGLPPVERAVAAAAEHPVLRAALWSVLRLPEVGAFYLSAALMVAAHMAIYAFYSLYLERAGYSKPLIGIMWAAGVVAEVGFFYYQSRFFARFGARPIMLFAFGLTALRFVLTGAAPGLVWLMVLAQLMHAVTFAAHHSACVMTMQRWFAGPLQASGQALYMSVAFAVATAVGVTYDGTLLPLAMLTCLLGTCLFAAVRLLALRTREVTS